MNQSHSHDVAADGAFLSQISDFRQASTAKGKCTPPEIEILLRRCNKQGITKYEEILESLQKENPPIHISRSTFFKYQRECGLGTARKNQMTDDEMREVVIQELSRPRSQSCGVEKVWKTLQTNGIYIKKDFVRKLMREVKMNWIPHPRQNQMLSDVSTTNSAPERIVDTVPEVPRPSQAANATFWESALPQAQFPSVPINISPATMQVLLQAQIITPGVSTESDRLDIVSEVHQTGPPINDAYVSGDGIVRSIHRQHAGDQAVDNTTSAIISGEEPSTVPSCISYPAITNADGGDALDTQSGGIEIPESLEDDVRDEYLQLFPLPPRTSTDFSMAIAHLSDEERIRQTLRIYLQSKVRDLLENFDKWFSMPFEHAISESVRSHSLPLRGNQEVTLCQQFPVRNNDDMERRYVPDYNVSEEDVTEDCLLLVRNLQHMLSRPKLYALVFDLSSKLWQLYGRLKDIGMTRWVLAAAAMNLLKVLRVVERVSGRTELVLRDLLECAVDCVQYLCDIDRGTTFHQAARIVEQAAHDLISIDPVNSGLNQAISFHYGLVADNHWQLWKVDSHTFKESLELFGRAMDSNYVDSRACLRQMLRAISILQGQASSHVPPALFRKYTSAVATDPTLSFLFVHAAAIASQWALSRSLCLLMEPLMKATIDHLRSLQNSRPSCVQKVLGHALYSLGRITHTLGLTNESIHAVEEDMVLTLRQPVFDDRAVEDMCDAICRYTRRQLEATPPRWKETLNGLSRITVLRNSCRGWEYLWCIADFTPYLEQTQSPEALSAALDLANFCRPFDPFADGLVTEDVLQLLIAISGLQRIRGQFVAALETSREALSLSQKHRQEHGKNCTDYRDLHFAIEAVHARLLLDQNADEPEIWGHLQEAVECWRVHCDAEYMRPQFNMLCALYPGRELFIPLRPATEILIQDTYYSGDVPIPAWLCSQPYDLRERRDDHAWELLLHAIHHMPTSREYSMECAQTSLTLMEEYHDWLIEQKEVGRSIFASVFGHKYILLSILGEFNKGIRVLDSTIAMYRAVLETEPHMARLPLLVLLEVLIIISLKTAALKFTTSFLQGCRKDVYEGSTSFFDDLVDFLKTLPNYIHARGTVNVL